MFNDVQSHTMEMIILLFPELLLLIMLYAFANFLTKLTQMNDSVLLISQILCQLN